MEENAKHEVMILLAWAGGFIFATLTFLLSQLLCQSVLGDMPLSFLFSLTFSLWILFEGERLLANRLLQTEE